MSLTRHLASLLLGDWRAGRWNCERPQSRVCAGGRAPAPFPAFLSNKYLRGLFSAQARLQVLGGMSKGARAPAPTERLLYLRDGWWCRKMPAWKVF